MPNTKIDNFMPQPSPLWAASIDPGWNLREEYDEAFVYRVLGWSIVNDRLRPVLEARPIFVQSYDHIKDWFFDSREEAKRHAKSLVRVYREAYYRNPEQVRREYPDDVRAALPGIFAPRTVNAGEDPDFGWLYGRAQSQEGANLRDLARRIRA